MQWAGLTSEGRRAEARPTLLPRHLHAEASRGEELNRTPPPSCHAPQLWAGTFRSHGIGSGDHLRPLHLQQRPGLLHHAPGAAAKGDGSSPLGMGEEPLTCARHHGYQSPLQRSLPAGPGRAIRSCWALPLPRLLSGAADDVTTSGIHPWTCWEPTLNFPIFPGWNVLQSRADPWARRTATKAGAGSRWRDDLSWTSSYAVASG